jgi:hypothetical protein
MQLMLAEIVSELRRDGVPMSPRTAIAALQLAQAAAAINGRDRIVPDDIKAIAFLPGAISHRDRIDQLIDSLRAAIESEEKLELARNELDQLAAKLRGNTSPGVAQSVARDANSIVHRLTNLRVSADQTGRHRGLTNDARSLAVEASSFGDRKALDGIAAEVSDMERALESSSAVDDWRQIQASARSVLNKLFSLTVNGANLDVQRNQLINDVQAISRLATEEQTKAQARANVNEGNERLDKITSRVNEIASLLSDRRVSSQDRDNMRRELAGYEDEVGRMSVDFSLESKRKNLLSGIRLVRMSSRSRV